MLSVYRKLFYLICFLRNNMNDSEINCADRRDSTAIIMHIAESIIGNDAASARMLEVDCRVNHIHS